MLGLILFAIILVMAIALIRAADRRQGVRVPLAIRRRAERRRRY
ncbi:MAG: hypothetical protein ACJ8CR_14440 [Roseiflexaceae bacterium]